jgi:hypothetical protein
MIFRMDTDAVRAMAIRFRQTADSMEDSLASLTNAVNSAPWQSQAREEFILRLASLQRSTQRSIAILRMMARAADRKADQWEVIANAFNGPFYHLENIWAQVRDFLSSGWAAIQNAISNIRLPSLPAFVFPSISGAMIIGGLSKLVPSWILTPPDGWWPFNREKGIEQPQPPSETEITDSGASTTNTEGAAQPETTTIQPVEPVGLSQDDAAWANETMKHPQHTLRYQGCLVTSVAMIARLHGADVTPSDVNQYMKANGGYVNAEDGTPGSYMGWGSAEKYLESAVGVDFSWQGVTSTNLASTLQSGQPVIIHVESSYSDDGHWVVATGVDSNGNFTTYDAADGSQKTFTPNQLHPKNDHKSFVRNG